MTHADLDKVGFDGPHGRDEIISVLAGLTEQVARLEVQVRRLVAMADARRRRSALRRHRKSKTVPQTQRKTASAATTCDVQPVDTAEASTVSLSPRQGGCAENAVRGENALFDNLAAQLESAFPPSHETNCAQESAIAARVADLHERLGGFVKASLQSA
jgi:hypothetical protein